MAHDFTALDHIQGVSAGVVANESGAVLHTIGAITTSTEEFTGLTTVFSRSLIEAGRALALGSCTLIVVRGHTKAHVLVPRKETTAAIELSSQRLTPQVEAQLRALDWTSPTPGERVAPPSPTILPGSGRPRDVPSGATPLQSLRQDTARPRFDVPSMPKTTGPVVSPAQQPSPPVPLHPPTQLPTEAHPPTTPKPLATLSNEVMLQGDLAMLCLPDLLEFLRSGQRTGRLHCATGVATGNVHLRNGKVINASSPSTLATSLLSRLRDGGHILEEQAKSVAREEDGAATDLIVAKRLLDNKHGRPEVVRQALLQQLQAAIKEISGWQQGSFTFFPEDNGATPGDSVIEIDTQMLLLAICKEQDEAGR
jgi:hypothetical protein